MTPAVQRFLLPLLAIFIGLILILSYLLLRSRPVGVGKIGGEIVASPSTYLVESSTDQPHDSPEIDAIQTSRGTPITTATQTPQPIIPTRTPVLAVTETRQSSIDEEAAALEEVSPTQPVALPSPNPCPLADCRNRVGVSGRQEIVNAAYGAGLHFGHYLTWWTEMYPDEPGGAQFWQLISIDRQGPLPTWDTLAELIEARPGSIWIIGNEPDIIWQDNIPADEYALQYHDIYAFIKNLDSEALIAIAGVGQPTALRMAYLDTVLDTYQEAFGEKMPIDIWTIHAFVLREERDSWGVGIPPGMAIEQGQLYEVKDHDNLAYFSQNLINFRAWMAKRGYQDVPLAVTEFGILHPADFGFPTHRVAEFMIGAFDFFATTTNDNGYPRDDYHLVQWWFWYSVYDGGDYPTGNLFNPETGQLTAIGQVFSSLVAGE